MLTLVEVQVKCILGFFWLSGISWHLAFDKKVITVVKTKTYEKAQRALTNEVPREIQ
jgi:hypothetical protein